MQMTFILIYWLGNLQALLAQTAQALPFLILMTLLAGRKGNAALCLWGGRQLLRLGLFCAALSLPLFPLMLLLEILRQPQMPPLADLLVQPASVALLAWLPATLLLWGLLRASRHWPDATDPAITAYRTSDLRLTLWGCLSAPSRTADGRKGVHPGRPLVRGLGRGGVSAFHHRLLEHPAGRPAAQPAQRRPLRHHAPDERPDPVGAGRPGHHQLERLPVPAPEGPQPCAAAPALVFPLHTDGRTAHPAAAPLTSLLPSPLRAMLARTSYPTPKDPLCATFFLLSCSC